MKPSRSALSSYPRLAGRIRARVQGSFSALSARLRIIAYHQMAGVRSLLNRAGVPLQKDFLVLNCMNEAEGYGFFAEFTFVLIALQHYEEFESNYAGLSVDFSRRGYYYDRRVGENWWEYFFEPIAIGSRSGATTKRWDNENNPFFSVDFGTTSLVTGRDTILPRTVWAELIRRHIRLKPHVQEKLDSFIHLNFEGAFVLGVHYRGTDSFGESPRVPYEEFVDAIRDATRRFPERPWKLFVATDEQAFLDHVRQLYPDKLLYQETTRSMSGPELPGLHVQLAGDYRSGEGALLDCLLLSRCDYLIRTESTLSLTSTLFNPDVPVTVIRPGALAAPK